MNTWAVIIDGGTGKVCYRNNAATSMVDTINDKFDEGSCTYYRTDVINNLAIYLIIYKQTSLIGLFYGEGGE